MKDFPWLRCPECNHKMGSLPRFCQQCGFGMPAPDVSVDKKEWEGTIKPFGRSKYGICGPIGHVFQKGLVAASFCAACGTDIMAEILAFKKREENKD